MKLYTQDNCQPCEVSKQIIKDKGLDVEVIHLDLNERASRDIQMENRIMSSPTLDTKDKRYIGTDVVDYLQYYI